MDPFLSHSGNDTSYLEMLDRNGCNLMEQLSKPAAVCLFTVLMNYTDKDCKFKVSLGYFG